MPGSSYKGKEVIKKWRSQLPAFKHVLDVGPGWGTYIKMLERPGEQWDCVEIHEPYVEKFGLDKLYNFIGIGSIVDFRPLYSYYDLIILGDVLEHLTETDAKSVLRKVLSYSNYVLVSLPLDAETNVPPENNSDYWENEHERHLGQWTNLGFLEAIRMAGGELIGMEKYQELAVYLIAGQQKTSFLTDNNKEPGEWKRVLKYYIYNSLPNFVKCRLIRR